MGIASNHLEAFLAVGRDLHFSRAAEKLGVTQSALSQRIKKLEEDLELTLFVRGTKGIRLTAAGERLLRYCQIKESLEEEFLAGLRDRSGSAELAGILRVRAYSSVMRSVIIPALAPLIRGHPKVICEFGVAEMNDLPAGLLRAETDFIVSDQKLELAGLERKSLGHECYVAIESASHRGPENVFLDHREDDSATIAFFSHQGKKIPPIKRAFMGDVYGVLDGVAHGFGRAVMPRHLLGSGKKFRILKQFKPRVVETYLYYHAQPYYTRLHKAAVTELTTRCPVYLKAESP